MSIKICLIQTGIRRDHRPLAITPRLQKHWVVYIRNRPRKIMKPRILVKNGRALEHWVNEKKSLYFASILKYTKRITNSKLQRWQFFTCFERMKFRSPVLACHHQCIIKNRFSYTHTPFDFKIKIFSPLGIHLYEMNHYSSRTVAFNFRFLLPFVLLRLWNSIIESKNWYASRLTFLVDKAINSNCQ